MAQTYGYEIDLELLLNTAAGVNDGAVIKTGDGFEVDDECHTYSWSSGAGVYSGSIAKNGDGFEVDDECHTYSWGSAALPIPDWTVYQAGSSAGPEIKLLGRQWHPGDTGYEILISGQVMLEYIAGIGGSISGDATQIVDEGESGTPVTAVAVSRWHFLRWSDGVLSQTRSDVVL